MGLHHGGIEPIGVARQADETIHDPDPVLDLNPLRRLEADRRIDEIIRKEAHAPLDVAVRVDGAGTRLIGRRGVRRDERLPDLQEHEVDPEVTRVVGRGVQRDDVVGVRVVRRAWRAPRPRARHGNDPPVDDSPHDWRLLPRALRAELEPVRPDHAGQEVAPRVRLVAEEARRRSPHDHLPVPLVAQVLEKDELSIQRRLPLLEDDIRILRGSGIQYARDTRSVIDGHAPAPRSHLGEATRLELQVAPMPSV